MENLEALPVNAIDIGVIIIILVSAVLAYARGFVHEVLSVGGWLGAILATIFFYPHVQPYARDYIPVELAADLSAGAAIFVITLVILSVTARSISSRVKDSALNMLDRSLGFLFGIARGALVVCVLYLGVEFLIPQKEQPEWITSARTMPLITRGAEMIVQLLPEDTDIDIDLPELNKNEAAQEILKLVMPKPEAESNNESDGYNEDERQNMERLIESQ